MSSDLASCPFCGSAGAALKVVDNRVACLGCGAVGPPVSVDGGVSFLWNRRSMGVDLSTRPEGRLLGFSYVRGSGRCVYCGLIGIPVLGGRAAKIPGLPDELVGTCEPCAALAGVAWRQLGGDAAPGYVVPVIEKAVVVLVMRDRQPGEGVVRDVLVASRKLEPSLVGVMGGKLEPGETAQDAALRELEEESGLTSWASALEPLYLGATPRGTVVRAYLARAWQGEVVPREGEPLAEWRPDPFIEGRIAQFGLLQWFYRGVREALELRERLASASGATLPLSLRLSKAAAQHVDLKLKAIAAGSASALDDEVLSKAFRQVMTDEEKAAADLIIGEAKRRADASRPPVPADVERGSDEGGGGDGDTVDAVWDEAEGSLAPRPVRR